MSTKILQIVMVLTGKQNDPRRTIIVYDPETKGQITYYCSYIFGKDDLGTYWKFEFAPESITGVHKLNGDDTFRLRRILNK